MSNANHIATIIIAGGKSTRMGSPKGLIQVKDYPLIQIHIDTFKSFSEKVVVVLGHHVKEYQEIIEKNPDVLFIENKKYLEGQFSSIHTGIKAICASEADHCFILPVDTAPLRRDTIQMLLESADSYQVIKPRYEGKSGHPILIGKSVIQKIEGSQLSNRLDLILKEQSISDVCWIEVKDKNINFNLNTPEAHQRYLNDEII